MRPINLIIITLFVLASSCSKSDSSSGNNTILPTGLTVTITVSTDNSGNVAFVATAANAVTYDYDFGNGVFQTVANGIVTYKYPASGTYTVNVIAKSSTGQTVSKSNQITVTVSTSLIWSEEFDVAGAPNSSRWGYDIGTGSGGWGNNELQYYTNRLDNAVVSNGTLKIIAKAENFSGSSYTSARLLTKDKFSFKYGKIEVRAKLPAGVGTWPAIWMLGNNISTVGWPACGEIDIMEHKGSQLNKIYGTLHYPGFSGGSAVGGTVTIANATTEFHKYSAIWSPAAIQFLVDDVPFYNFANSVSLPFNQNFFVILNLAMGGNFGGSVDPAFSTATMEVDYVRVYQ
jgi:beta-glucanase (GH16 family)